MNKMSQMKMDALERFATSFRADFRFAPINIMMLVALCLLGLVVHLAVFPFNLEAVITMIGIAMGLAMTFRLFQIWEQQGASLACVAFLVDALEPLNRQAHVISGDEIVVADRCRLREGRYGGIELRVALINRNATRALLRPAAPIPVDADPASFRLVFGTSDGTLTGRRQMRVRPLMLDLEGF